MTTITETIDGFPRRNTVDDVERDEELLLSPPIPGPMKLWEDPPLLGVVHFPQEYKATPFAPPRGIYEAAHLRMEWQTMDNRQPFYHRNCDVDELSYQIAGERTLITERGVIEHRPGEFSRIPVSVAHDNYGRKESHLIFYVPAPVSEAQPALRTSEPVFPVFPGWAPAMINEATTTNLGAPGSLVAISPVQEQTLLESVYHTDQRLEVLATAENPGTTWLYRSADVWIGTSRLTGEAGWLRHHGADEVQYQISGTRTVVSQYGTVVLGPGDLVRIPLGVAYANVVTEGESQHIALLSALPLTQVAPTDRAAEPSSYAELQRLRQQ